MAQNTKDLHITPLSKPKIEKKKKITSTLMLHWEKKKGTLAAGC